MPDMLVKLYQLPEIDPVLAKLKEAGIEIRRAKASERQLLSGWVRLHFWETWASECEASMDNRPVTCFVAVQKDPNFHPDGNPYSLPEEDVLGFACYDIVFKGMFGPLGVHEKWQGKSIGKALLLTCLHEMKRDGYAYAIIAWVELQEFYSKTVKATPIADSEPGPHRGRIRVNNGG